MAGYPMFSKKDASQRLFLCRLLLLLCFLSSAATFSARADNACSSQHYDETTAVSYIHDGDTLHLKDGRKVRLIGINTPELARDKRPAEAYASEAKNALKALFSRDKTINLLFGDDKKDRYGRILAHTFLTDGQNVQSSLLQQGLAMAISIPPNTRFAACYLQLEHEARCNKTGLWQSKNIIAAEQLSRKHTGFQLVRGKVTSISQNDKGFWLNLENKLTIGIRPENLAEFDTKTLHDLSGQTIVVRGWINNSKHSTPFYVRVQHPLSIQLATNYNCR